MERLGRHEQHAAPSHQRRVEPPSIIRPGLPVDDGEAHVSNSQVLLEQVAVLDEQRLRRRQHGSDPVFSPIREPGQYCLHVQQRHDGLSQPRRQHEQRVPLQAPHRGVGLILTWREGIGRDRWIQDGQEQPFAPTNRLGLPFARGLLQRGDHDLRACFHKASDLPNSERRVSVLSRLDLGAKGDLLRVQASNHEHQRASILIPPLSIGYKAKSGALPL
jgi:hypothetical protein